MSMETYEKSLARLELYQKLAEAKAQIKNGNELLDGEEVFRKIREKHVRKKCEIKITPKAIDDLDEIYGYIFEELFNLDAEGH